MRPARSPNLTGKTQGRYRIRELTFDQVRDEVTGLDPGALAVLPDVRGGAGGMDGEGG